MPSTLQPYPTYKDSGVDWLGDVPEHWNTQRLGTISVSLDGRRIPLAADVRGQMQGSIPYWGANSIIDYVNDWIFDENLVLLGEDGAPFFDANRPVAFAVNSRIWVNNHAHVLRPKSGIDHRWLARALNVVDYRAYITGSTRDKLTASAMRSIALPLSPLDEQCAIADFLDAMDARIAHFIAARRKMITLLEEQKQAVINQAVTRGLDPDVPMKDSGVEWLGEIPAHWQIRRGASLFTERNETGFPDLPILEVSLNTGVTIRDMDDSRRKQMMSDRSGYKRTLAGDLPYNMMRMWQGAIGIAPVDGLVSPAYVVLTPKQTSVSGYYAALFRTPFFKGEVSGRSRGIVSDRDRLYWDSFRQIQMPWPSWDEQQRIVNHFDREAARIDTLISRHRREMELMQEYRTRLISDIVTGKLDVRGVELPPVEAVVDEEIEATMEDEELVIELEEIEA